MGKAAAIIQARMGSTRLPGKVMMELCGKPVLEHVVERVKQCSQIHEIIIATTNLKKDNVIVEEAQKYGVKYFKGSEDDVLSRYYHAAKENNADIIVRITSDCPLIDPNITDNVVECFKHNDYKLVTNAGVDLEHRTFPRGLDTEVFSFEVLEEAYKKASEPYQREHVTPYIYETYDNIYFYKNSKDYSKYRWTLDTQEDYKFIKAVYQHLYKGKHDFYMHEILNLIEEKTELIKYNSHIQQKKIK